jgi:hypothetical protein
LKGLLPDIMRIECGAGSRQACEAVQADDDLL